MHDHIIVDSLERKLVLLLFIINPLCCHPFLSLNHWTTSMKRSLQKYSKKHKWVDKQNDHFARSSENYYISMFFACILFPFCLMKISLSMRTVKVTATIFIYLKMKDYLINFPVW